MICQSHLLTDDGLWVMHGLEVAAVFLETRDKFKWGGKCYCAASVTVLYVCVCVRACTWVRQECKGTHTHTHTVVTRMWNVRESGQWFLKCPSRFVEDGGQRASVFCHLLHTDTTHSGSSCWTRVDKHGTSTEEKAALTVLSGDISSC